MEDEKHPDTMVLQKGCEPQGLAAMVNEQNKCLKAVNIPLLTLQLFRGAAFLNKEVKERPAIRQKQRLDLFGTAVQ